MIATGGQGATYSASDCGYGGEGGTGSISVGQILKGKYVSTYKNY